MADLAAAYASLETHASLLKERVTSLESSGGGEGAFFGVEKTGVVGVEGRRRARETQRETHPHTHLPHPHTAAPSSADIDRRIAEAAAKATAEAEDGVNDLLVCLGQEERKVELLSARLAELGVDAAAIVASVGGDDLT